MLKTRSLFYYGCEIVENYNKFELVEGSVTSIVTLRTGEYSPFTLAVELERAMNEVGSQAYEVSFVRSTRRLLVEALSPFTIKIISSPLWPSRIFDDLGFGNTDFTGTYFYAPNPVGKVFRPQFYLLDYVDGEESQKLADASVNEAGSGNFEVIRFGINKFYEFTIDFVTNEPQSHNSLIETDYKAKESLIDFLSYSIKKLPVEFMKDRNNVDDWKLLYLEQTQADSKGTGFKITEKAGYDGYYTSGRLVWREGKIID